MYLKTISNISLCFKNNFTQHSFTTNGEMLKAWVSTQPSFSVAHPSPDFRAPPQPFKSLQQGSRQPVVMKVMATIHLLDAGWVIRHGIAHYAEIRSLPPKVYTSSW